MSSLRKNHPISKILNLDTQVTNPGPSTCLAIKHKESKIKCHHILTEKSLSTGRAGALSITFNHFRLLTFPIIYTSFSLVIILKKVRAALIVHAIQSLVVTQSIVKFSTCDSSSRNLLGFQEK